MPARVGLALGYDPKASVAQMARWAADAERHGFAMVFFSLDAGVSPEYAARAIAIVRAAAAQAKRDVSRLEIAQLINTSIDDDRGRAIDAVGGRSRASSAIRGHRS